MGLRIKKGSIVLFPFPFSDLSNQKNRPALILAKASPTTYIAAKVTSTLKDDDFCINLLPEDLTNPLRNHSQVRLHDVFTVSKDIIKRVYSQVEPEKMQEIYTQFCKAFK